jgi:Zn-dependent protease/predicted transcriptional regulator
VFGKSYPLFKLLGFEVRIDLTWLILAVLITWSLATGLFPAYFGGLSQRSYWLMGVAGAVGLLFSIVFHELSHSLVARMFGLPIKGITLFIFGGVAEMDDEPPSAKAEFLMAAAGPLASIVLAFALYGIFKLGTASDWQLAIAGVIGYLAYLNGLLAVFNLVPAFPLDGGRMLRAALWGWQSNFRSATRIAAAIGAGFGWVLIGLGVLAVLSGNFIGGMWWSLIGMFLRGAAHMSYRQVLMRQALQGEPVRRFMNTTPVTVPSGISVQQFIEEYVYKYHFEMFPVVDDSRLLGWVSTREVKSIPRDDWGFRRVGDIYQPASSDNSISPETDTVKALSIMNHTGRTRLMVVDRDKVVGILTLKDLMKFLSLKVDLNEFG